MNFIATYLIPKKGKEWWWPLENREGLITETDLQMAVVILYLLPLLGGILLIAYGACERKMGRMVTGFSLLIISMGTTYLSPWISTEVMRLFFLFFLVFGIPFFVIGLVLRWTEGPPRH